MSTPRRRDAIPNYRFLLAKRILRVFFGSALTAAVAFPAKIVVAVAVTLVFFPLVVILARHWELVTMTASAMVCSMAAGHIAPRRAFFRGGLVFPWILAVDVIYFFHAGSRWIVDWNGQTPAMLAAIVVIGMFGCAYAGALGSRMRRHFRAWVRDHLDEFRESVGVFGEENDPAEATSEHNPVDTDAPDMAHEET